MRAAARVAAAVAALALLALLAHAVLAPESAPRRWPLLILSVVGLAAFEWRGWRWALAMLVPAGPVIDWFFLTPDRGIYATEALLVVALAGWLGRLALNRGDPPALRPSGPVLALTAFGLVGVAALLIGHAGSFDAFVAWRTLRVLALAAGCAAMFSAIAAARPIVAPWSLATLAALLVLAVGGLVEFVVDGAGQFEAGSFYGSSIGLAVHLALVMPFALSVALGPSRSRWRLLAAMAWLAGLVCLPLSTSRGALGSVAVTTVLALVVAGRRRGHRAWLPALIIAGLVMAGGVILGLNPELAGEGFAYKLRASVAGDFFSTRTAQWSEAGSAIAAHPLTGEGPTTWSPSMPLELARRHGLPAALLMLGAVAWAAVAVGRSAWRLDARPTDDEAAWHPASLRWGLALSLLGLMLVGLAETGLGARSTPLVALTLVLAAQLGRER